MGLHGLDPHAPRAQHPPGMNTPRHGTLSVVARRGVGAWRTASTFGTLHWDVRTCNATGKLWGTVVETTHSKRKAGQDFLKLSEVMPSPGL